MYKAGDHILIIFGASGDLTRRKLIPALRELQKLDLLPERFAVLGIGRSSYDDQSFREMISSAFVSLWRVKTVTRAIPEIWKRLLNIF